MEAERIQELIGKYNAMLADPAELKEIEALIERGKIDLNALYDLHTLDEQVMNMATPSPSLALDDSFYEMLKREKKQQKPSWLKGFFTWPELVPRLSFASVALLLGFAGGHFLRSPVKQDPQIEVLGQQVSDLKELMMLSLLEKESATDRLKAVSLSEEMGQASQKVTGALLQTLNSDENVNVRLAALDALRPYSHEGKIREQLIRSIALQESALVQIALAELMAELNAKSSVKEFEKILKHESTPPDVRKKIRESIKVLI